MSKISKAVSYIKSVANGNHGYSQINRWAGRTFVSADDKMFISVPESGDFDCSSLVISAYQYAGLKTFTNGATYTGNMLGAFKMSGFTDVTSKINLSTGAGLQAGDVLLNTKCHTAMYIGGGQLAQASIDENGNISGGKSGDQTGSEINIRNYYSYPWDYVLRYPEPAEKICDKSGYRLGDRDIGVLALKRLLKIAYKQGIVSKKVSNNGLFGRWTKTAVNQYLKHKGYAQNGIAGAKFITLLSNEIYSKIK